jgi:hypothetical protein
MPLNVSVPPVFVPNAVEPTREVRDLPRRQDLAGLGLAAEARGEVERTAAVTTLDLDSLAGIQADADGERKFRLLHGLVHEPLLELDGGSDRLARRGEDAQGLVAPELEQRAPAGLDRFPCDVGELRGKFGRRLVAALLREQRVAADVRDQERPDLNIAPVGVNRRFGLGHHGIIRCPCTLCREGCLTFG